MVVSILGDLNGGDEVVLGVNSGLDVVADGGLAAFAQLAAVGIGEVGLAGGAFLTGGAMTFENGLAGLDLVELAAQFLDVAFVGFDRAVGLVGLGEGGDVVGDGLVDAFDEFFDLGFGEAAGGAVDGFDKGAVDGNRVPCRRAVARSK